MQRPVAHDPRVVFALLVALGASACGESSTPSAVASRIVFTSDNVLVGLNGDVTLAPFVFDEDDDPIVPADPLIWTSSNEAIATVSGAGVVAGLTLGGPVTVTAVLGDLTASVSVRVVPAQVVISPALSALEVGLSATLSAQVLDALGDPIPSVTVTWSNQSPAVVSLDQNTLELEALAPGIAGISASAAGRTSTMSVLVGVVSAYDGTFVTGVGASSDAQIEVVFGRVTRFTATLRPSAMCGIAVSSSPNAVIAGDGTFSFGLAGSPGIVVGTFTSTSLVNGVVGSVPNNPACGIPSSTGNLPAVSFSAARP